MEVSALRYSGGIGLHARSPLLRLQSDERLVALIRRGSSAAFEVLVSRYHARLLAFCRHLLGSREDAEDVLQEVFVGRLQRDPRRRPPDQRAAVAVPDRPQPQPQPPAPDPGHRRRLDGHPPVRPRRHHRGQGPRARGVPLLVGDIQALPETQRTALVLREMDALSYEQIAEAMETTVPSVKSLLVRARVSLAEAAEARAADLRRRSDRAGRGGRGPAPPARARWSAATCAPASAARPSAASSSETNKALAALLPIGRPLVLLQKLAIAHLGHSAGAGSSASGAGAAGHGRGRRAPPPRRAPPRSSGSTGSGFVSAGVGAIATKAAAGLAAAALVTAGAVEVDQPARPPAPPRRDPRRVGPGSARARHDRGAGGPARAGRRAPPDGRQARAAQGQAGQGHRDHPARRRRPPPSRRPPPPTRPRPSPRCRPGRTQTQTDATVLPARPRRAWRPPEAGDDRHDRRRHDHHHYASEHLNDDGEHDARAPKLGSQHRHDHRSDFHHAGTGHRSVAPSDPTDPSCPPPSGGVAPPGSTTP